MSTVSASGKSRRPLDTPFRQQNQKRWHPLLTPLRTIVLFLTVGAVFVPIGVAVISAADGVVEVTSDDYATACCVGNCTSPVADGKIDNTARIDLNPCNVTITVTEKMTAPVYLYYELSNFYQNHRDYVKSRSDGQLSTKLDPTTQKSIDRFEDACENNVYLKEVSAYACDEDADDCNKSAVIFPCGSVAWSMFNDTLKLYDANGHSMASVVDETAISWKSDRDMKFKNYAQGHSGLNFHGFAYERASRCSDLPTATQQQACSAAGIPEAGWCYPGSGKCVEDEHFIVWMRTAARPDFRKLYAKIDRDLAPGDYTIMVSNGREYPGYSGYYNPWLSTAYYADPQNAAPVPQTFLWPAHTFGKKRIVLSTTSWVGGKNGFLGWAYLVVGVVCIVLALAFAVKLQLSPRKLGTASFVTGDK